MTARNFAFDAHKDQKYGDQPFYVHLVDVTGILREFGFTDESMQAAAYLHDVVEDTDVTIDDIRREFGLPVAMLVWGVTDEPGANRKERKAKTYPKIAANPECIILKLADRIANMTTALGRDDAEGKRFLKMYRDEYAEFRRALFRPEHTAALPMWDALERFQESEK